MKTDIKLVYNTKKNVTIVQSYKISHICFSNGWIVLDITEVGVTNVVAGVP